MKKSVLAIALFTTMTLGLSAQSVEKRLNTEKGKLTITSAENLFSNCDMRMCSLVPTDGKGVYYGIELDLTDRVHRVSKGDLLIITFEDGSKIELENLFDTKAEVSQEESTRVDHDVNTTYVTGYDPWLDVFYSEPVTHVSTRTVPVTTTTSFAELYYIVTPEQIKKIINSNISEFRLVTDDGTIVKKARPFCETVKTLFPLVQKK